MKFLAAASVLFLGALAVPTTQCGECDKNQHEHSGDNYPVGNHGGSYPGGNSGYPGHPTPGYPGGNNPGGNNPGGPGGNNPGGPGGNNPGGPGGNSPGSAYGACTSQLYSNAQCCSVDVLGLLGLDCANPTQNPTSASDFQSTCTKVGKQPRCCLLPVAGQDVLCVKPTGVY